VSRQEDRRRAILAAASDVFLRLGYGGATIDEVIRRVGGSKRTIYRHFQCKEDLFAAVVDDVVGETVRPLPDIRTSKLGVRDTLLLVAVQHMSVVLSERHMALARLVVAESPRLPEVGRTYYEHGPARGHAQLRLYFEKQRRQGTLAISDVADAADYFWGMLLHHGTLRRLYRVAPEPDLVDVQAASARVVDAFLSLYGTKETQRLRRG
jgi:AcrR family transcriptional regulator